MRRVSETSYDLVEQQHWHVSLKVIPKEEFISIYECLINTRILGALVGLHGRGTMVVLKVSGPLDL